MPRKARLDIPGLLQHVIVRGIERSTIFFDDDDRAMFVNRFSALLEETGTDCFAWAMIPNHFHLLLRCNQTDLSRFMRRLLTGYAINFNQRHKRTGHLFQNRYKSIICQEDTYLLELIRYIHLNPLRAKLVEDMAALDQYPWSGHAVIMGKRQLAGQKVDEILLHFGSRVATARRHYRQFVEDGIKQGKRPELTGGGLRRSQRTSGAEKELESYDDRILGSGEFVDELRQEKILREKIPLVVTILELLNKVGSVFGVETAAMRRRGRNNAVSEARAVFCFLAITQLGATGAEVEKQLLFGSSAVSRALRRGEEILRQRPALGKHLVFSLKQ